MGELRSLTLIVENKSVRDSLQNKAIKKDTRPKIEIADRLGITRESDAVFLQKEKHKITDTVKESKIPYSM